MIVVMLKLDLIHKTKYLYFFIYHCLNKPKLFNNSKSIENISKIICR